MIFKWFFYTLQLILISLRFKFNNCFGGSFLVPNHNTMKAKKNLSYKSFTAIINILSFSSKYNFITFLICTSHKIKLSGQFYKNNLTYEHYKFRLTFLYVKYLCLSTSNVPVMSQCKALFTLNVCACICVSICVKVLY